jgi:GT2 family glycosyltransferase
MKATLTFSVGISTFNRNEDLSRCLDSLSKQTFTDFDIVIVNGGDYEGVKQTVENFKGLRIKVVNQQRKGIVEARNLGWIESNADVVCLIDDDLVVSPQWLETVKNTFLSDEKIGGVSGPTLIPEEKMKNRDLALFLGQFKKSPNIFLKLIGKLYFGVILENRVKDVGRILNSGTFTPGSNYPSCLDLPAPVEVDYLEACHMCFYRDLFQKLGGFDYSYTGTGEWNEPDFAFKVRKLGYRLIFNPKAVTWHYISQGGVFKARTYAYERSRNFIYFYLNNVKLNSFDKFFRFGINLCFINAYWLYKFFQSKNKDWLCGIWGTAVELFVRRKQPSLPPPKS